ncbi:ABC transporter ATP-binding protein, putative [Bodo saltans]|uniref:ABC transporter ATP-binding protein, putative n=1 Tax=Bodo saltans TaxID=75058 RepID=A0A0S4IPA5_BODSA|nr:ABC transporter ATP-binding protein, putative [Bodo saltans]|eukprot:CUF82773.1 ABC transporter ATP-binding protein, putative [Bodo saltans]
MRHSLRSNDVALFAVTLAMIAAAVFAVRIPDATGKSTWLADLNIVSFDNTTLHADAFIPVASSTTELFPVIIFPNSWGCPQLEYVTRALQLGDRGYVALEYETRGWWLSGGEIDMAGPKDIQDAQVVIDFVAAHATEWQADMTRVAMAGISYGAGITLLTAGTDARVKVAVAMSGWNNLTDFAYGEQTPNYKQTQGLLHSSEDLGHPSAEMFELERDLTNHTNVSFITTFGNSRSPQRLVDVFNARNIPVFLSSNYGDRFFRPQYMLEFFPALTCPKMLLLNNGPHAMPEAVGLFVNTSYIWNQALLWLEAHLKNISNGIDAQKPLQMELGTSIFSESRLNFTSDPSASTQPWYLARDGSLNPTAPPHNESSVLEPTIFFSTTQVLNSGTSDDTWEALGLPFVTNLSSANVTTTALFQSAPLTSATLVCGTPSVQLRLGTTSSTGFQVYAFLYEVDPLFPTDGTYLTEGFYTQWASSPSPSVTTVTFPMHTLCRVIDVGSSIVLGIVLYNEQYVPANSSPEFSVSFATGGESVLRLPSS